jgi:hypothetical protein
VSALLCWQSAFLFLSFWLTIANALDVASKTGDIAEQKILGGFTDGNIRTHGNEFQHVADLGTLRDCISNSLKRPFHTSAADDAQDVQTFPALLSALEVMQSEFFTVWQGTWTQSIDWTAAVLGTYVAGVLSTLTTSLSNFVPSTDEFDEAAKAHENLVNRYFSQLQSFYFGQNAFSLRTQAYDDMLWVVLGWLEAIKFAQLHSSLHYQQDGLGGVSNGSMSWYGTQFIPAFAHRARVFWDIAFGGWDTYLCGGGMIWSPYLLPYKNAITNELFITASISMYLHFPGDDNMSPFADKDDIAKPHDPKYLEAALNGYKWLSVSNMTNSKGLFTDGFHISGYRRGVNGSNTSTQCDERNEMVYTYNQGVILSGLRGLWEATGARSYLEDGHELIENVIRATGFQGLQDDSNYLNIPEWHGLGRRGILEDACDATGRCSQDSQTFKGIFFHHLTAFCAPLPSSVPVFEPDGRRLVFEDLRIWHAESCSKYSGWVAYNAQAALTTKDENGLFGMWWGAHYASLGEEDIHELPPNAVDYRNDGVPRDDIWTGLPSGDHVPYKPSAEDELPHQELKFKRVRPDANDRGRGRTVETQGGGIAVLRAMWEIVDLRLVHR